jgi:hypothetical protein
VVLVWSAHHAMQDTPTKSLLLLDPMMMQIQIPLHLAWTIRLPGPRHATMLSCYHATIPSASKGA